MTGEVSRWHRMEEAVWDGVFLGCLALGTVLASFGSRDRGATLATIGIALAFAGWHWLLAMRDRGLAQRPVMVVWLAGAVIFTAVLLGRDGAYFLLVWGLYPQLFILLDRWALPGILLTTGVVGWRIGAITEGLTSPAAISLLVSAALAALIGYSLRAVAVQSEQRQAALDELEATRAELAEASRIAGALEERARLSREVHDTVAQGFTGILMQLEACDQALEADPRTARAHLTMARDSARESLSEVRRAVHALRPEPLDGIGLVEALQRTVDRFASSSGVQATFATTGTPASLPPDVEVALLRGVQEGLANVARHAGGAAVRVTLDMSGAGVRLEVADDGAGFDPAAEGGDGVGLRGMRERLAALGGTLAVDSAPGAGTRLRLAVPGS